jgi:hypothetical protein
MIKLCPILHNPSPETQCENHKDDPNVNICANSHLEIIGCAVVCWNFAPKTKLK